MRPHLRRATTIAGIAAATLALAAGVVQADDADGTTTEPPDAEVSAEVTVSSFDDGDTAATTSVEVEAEVDPDGQVQSDVVQSDLFTMSSTAPPAEGTKCAIQSAEVSGGTATFTVGPQGCEGEIGPISFSTFSLPGGMREPYEDQVLIAHAEGNGQSYGEGSYSLSATLADACNWQSDLYFGVNLMPKFSGLIAYDYSEGNDCGNGEPVEAEECVLLAADVERETATFTVGPEDCEGEVGPISFSAFLLPGGMREPYEEQVLIAHHESNGAFYGAGSYELTIDMGTPCNWQTDLYFGVNLMPKFRALIAYDFDEREVCAGETTTTTTTTTTIAEGSGGEATSTTTSVAAAAGETTTTAVASQAGSETTTTAVADGGGETTTTTAVVAGAAGETTTTSVASAGPVPGQAGGGTLPSTGSSTATIVALLAGILVAAGVLVRRLAS